MWRRRKTRPQQLGSEGILLGHPDNTPRMENPVTIISTDSEHEIPPRPSIIPRRARYGDTSNAQEQWEQIPPERQYSDEADPVPPYLEQDWEEYQQQLAISRSFQEQRGSKERGNLNTEQQETQSIRELTNEFLQWVNETNLQDANREPKLETSTIQNQVETKPLNHRQRRGMEWKSMKERENKATGLPTPTTTPEQEQEPQTSTAKPTPVTGNFIRDSPPHQSMLESQFEYTNPYKRDNKPGVGTSTAGQHMYEYPYIPNKGKGRELEDHGNNHKDQSPSTRTPAVPSYDNFESISTRGVKVGYTPPIKSPLNTGNSQNNYDKEIPEQGNNNIGQSGGEQGNLEDRSSIISNHQQVIKLSKGTPFQTNVGVGGGDKPSSLDPHDYNSDSNDERPQTPNNPKNTGTRNLILSMGGGGGGPPSYHGNSHAAIVHVPEGGEMEEEAHSVVKVMDILEILSQIVREEAGIRGREERDGIQIRDGEEMVVMAAMAVMAVMEENQKTVRKMKRKREEREREIVLCRLGPGSEAPATAQKPRPGLVKNLSRALAPRKGRLRPGPGAKKIGLGR
ncbi:hypothetical protein BDP27DRAFT_1362780 [Rhodocollybia butyracea]|uniref:Uncharacterized protein n=1 Tax=Rhodocollybia butyracea TaxID=206335 RepID=A0A9P5U8R7_9AGAR|nr:hypothetical protein BDP27DRAFT_1362780 [Rhodocollybia butyracea]